MKFNSRNVVIILSLVLSYAIIHSTAEQLPDIFYSLLGVRVEEGFFIKYKFPVAILALLLFPLINWLKKKLIL
ncbi:MAG: hypothetical protein HOF21_11040 [Nitrospina sp.]|jgi:hypothetical protein|nr:hypothetical protein [Nitrospina sp.]MBT5633402.1 hypothetical protein [Nitrospina sp.]